MDSNGNVNIFGTRRFPAQAGNSSSSHPFIYDINSASGPTPSVGWVVLGPVATSFQYYYGLMDKNTSLTLAEFAQHYQSQSNQKFWGGKFFNYSIRNNYTYEKVT